VAYSDWLGEERAPIFEREEARKPKSKKVVIMAHTHTPCFARPLPPSRKLFTASRREEDDHTIRKLHTSDAEVVAPHLVQLWR